ncbi:unnamed protein product, partial [Closterium sp. NIES-54]
TITGLSLFDITSGASTAPTADADSTVRSQWLMCDAAARLAVRNHLPSTEGAHLSKYKSARALYNAEVARYPPTTAALNRLMLPYLFRDLAAFATVADLVAHLRTSDARYRAALPTEFLPTNSPPMYITLYYLVTRLPDSLSSVRDQFLSLCPTELTVDLLEERLAAAEKSILAVGASRGDRRTPFFVGCSPVPLLPSVASAAAVDPVGTEEVGAVSAPSGRRRTGKGKGSKGGGGGGRGSGGGDGGGGGGGGGGPGGGGVGSGSGGRGGGGGGGGGGGSGGGGSSHAAWRPWSGGAGPCTYVLRTGTRTGEVCGLPHTTQRCFGRLTDAWRTQFPDAVELPRWNDLLLQNVPIFHLDFDAILAAMYAIADITEGDCYLRVPPDPGTVAAALGASAAASLGASASATPVAGQSPLSGIAPTESFHTFTIDSGASHSFFRDSTTLTPLSRPVAVSLADPSGGPVLAHSSTVLPCAAAPSSLLPGLHLPSFSTNLVSGADLQDAWVDQFTPRGQRVTHCTCSRTGRHLATFTRRPGSSPYALTTAPPPVCTSGQVAASSQVFAAASRSSPASAPCSCRPLSNETLLWHHRLGHPSLPRLRGMASHTLVSGLPRSLPPLPPGPAPTGVPCVEGRQRAAPRSSSFPPTEAPLQNLHMDVWGPARVRGQGHERYFLLIVDDYLRYTTVFPLRSKGEVTKVLIDWIRGARRQLSESFGSDLPILRLHSDRGGEFSSDLLRAFCHMEGIRQTFKLPSSPQQNGIAERRIGMVMDVARASMIHAAAPQFLWPFAGPALSGVSQVDPAKPIEVAVDSGAARGVETGGAETGAGAPLTAATAATAAMTSPNALTFDAEGCAVDFDVWVDDLQLFLQCDSEDGVSLFDHTSGVSPAPAATADSTVRLQWTTRDAVARLAVRSHLPSAERAHFGQYKTAKSLYDAVVARYSSPATAALSYPMLPYLFPDLAAFATVADLITHLRTSDARYRTTLPTEFCSKNPPPPMYITLLYLVTRLPDSLSSVKDHFLSLCPTELTVDMLEERLIAAEKSIVAVGSSRGDPRAPFFEGCSPVPLLPSIVSVAANDLVGTKEVGAASAPSGRRRNSKGKGGKGGGGDGGVAVEAVEEAEGVAVEVGVVAGVGASVEAVGVVEAAAAAVEAAEAVVEVAAAVVVVEMEPRSVEALVVASASSSCLPVRSRQPSSFLSGTLGVGGLGFPDAVELPRWGDLLKQNVAIFDLDFDAILAAMYAVTDSAEGDCYLCVPPDPGIEAAALGDSESAAPGTSESAALGAGESALSGTAPTEALHTFTLDSGASRSFFCDSTTLTPLSRPVAVSLADPSGGPVLAHSSTVLPCPAAPSGLLSGLHLPSFSTNLVSGADLQDVWVDQFNPGGQRVTHCTCFRTDRHLATFTRRPGSSLYTLTTSSPPVIAFGQVAASGQTLHIDVWGPARVHGQGHERYFLLIVDDYLRYTTVFPLRRKGDVTEVLIDWIRGARRQLSESFGLDLPLLRLHSDRGGEFSSDLLTAFCRAEGIRQTFTLPASPQQNGIDERHIGMVMDVARTSMIHAAAPHFLWPFAGPAPSGVSQVDHVEPIEVAVDSGAARGAEPAGAGPGGAEPGVAESEGAEPGGAEPERVEPEGAEPGGPPSVPSQREPLSPQRLHEWYARRCSHAAGATGPAVGGSSRAGAGGGAAGAGAAGAAGLGGAGAGGPGAVGGPASVGAARGAGAAGLGGARTGGDGAVGAGGAAGVGAVGAGANATGGAAGNELLEVPELVVLREFKLATLELRVLPASPLTGPSPYSGLTRGLTERREPESRLESPFRAVCTGRCVPCQRPPPVPGTHYMTLHPFTAPQRVPLPCPPASSLPDGRDAESDSLRAASPTVTLAELVVFAAACRLDYATSLVAEFESAFICPPSVGGECALGTDVLEDRQEEFECFAAALPHLVPMLLAPEGDPDAPDIPTPRSYAEAIEGPYSQWQTAMYTEMASWKSTGTYVDEVPPPWANIVSGMWNFRVKRPPGSPLVFKAHYVARGFSQRQGDDFFQTFSPTPKMTTLRVLLHVAAQRDYELHSLDFSTAFLQGSLHEEIWLRRPPGFIGSFRAGTQWSLRQPVYSLHQAPRELHDTLRMTLAALEFAPSTADPSLFLRTDTTLPPFYVLVYVDDLVFATADTKAFTHVNSEPQKRHTCTDQGELTSYLGLRITWDIAQRTITLTQSHMVQQVLQRFGFTYSLPKSTPLPTGHSLSAPPSDESVEPSGPYPELVGCLMYLMTCTRPDLA